jgi:hypothetical protein
MPRAVLAPGATRMAVRPTATRMRRVDRHARGRLLAPGGWTVRRERYRPRGSTEPNTANWVVGATRRAIVLAVFGVVVLGIPLGRARVVPRKQPMRLYPRDRVMH